MVIIKRRGKHRQEIGHRTGSWLSAPRRNRETDRTGALAGRIAQESVCVGVRRPHAGCGEERSVTLGAIGLPPAPRGGLTCVACPDPISEKVRGDGMAEGLPAAHPHGLS